MFAGPGRRAAAALIDALIAGALVLLSMPLPGLALTFLPPLPAGAPLFLLPLVLPILYLVLFPVTRAQATPGKRACAIKIATLGGDRIGLARSIVRFVASLVSIAALFLGCLLMVWNRKHRALHDFAAGTVVVDAKARPPEIAWSEAAPASWTWRFAGTGAYVAVAALLVLLYRGPMHGDLASEVNEHNMSRALPVVAALDAYREKNGRYPETLEALSPGYIAGAPRLIGSTGLGFASTPAGDRCWLAIVYWKEAGLFLPSDRVYEYDCRTREWANLDYNDMHATAASR
jgi:uncharacterized RDD family membrane protein YckC